MESPLLPRLDKLSHLDLRHYRHVCSAPVLRDYEGRTQSIQATHEVLRRQSGKLSLFGSPCLSDGLFRSSS